MLLVAGGNPQPLFFNECMHLYINIEQNSSTLSQLINFHFLLFMPTYTLTWLQSYHLVVWRSPLLSRLAQVKRFPGEAHAESRKISSACEKDLQQNPWNWGEGASN